MADLSLISPFFRLICFERGVFSKPELGKKGMKVLVIFFLMIHFAMVYLDSFVDCVLFSLVFLFYSFN